MVITLKSVKITRYLLRHSGLSGVNRKCRTYYADSLRRPYCTTVVTSTTLPQVVPNMAGIQVLNGFRAETGVYHCNDGYFYHYNNCNDYARNGGGSPVHYFRCKNYYERGCTGSAKATCNGDGVQWENLTRHVCARDHEFARVRVLREEIIQEALRLDGPYEAPASVVERVRNRWVILGVSGALTSFVICCNSWFWFLRFL